MNIIYLISFFYVYFSRKRVGLAFFMCFLALIRELMLCASDSILEIYFRVKESSSAIVQNAS